MSEDNKAVRLKKSLTVSDGVALLIGITIGSGIYATPSLIAGYFTSFSAILICWIAIGIFVMIGGLIYAELGTRMPQTGGEYMYISRSFGPFAGFMFGWAQLFIIRTSPAAGLAIVAADYTGFFISMSEATQTGLAIVIILLLGLFNYVGIKWAALFQQFSTSLKVLGLLIFAVGGLLLLNSTTSQLNTTATPTAQLGPIGNLVAALMLVVFSHTGWDRVGYVAGEMKNPRKIIPKSMVIGLSFILLIYWAIITLYHYALGMEGIRATTTPAADTASLMMGTYGGIFIALIAIISAVSSINGTIMSATRVYYAMARDRLFFSWINYIHPKYRTPTRAIIAHCAWAIVILLVRGSFATIVAGMVFAILIFYAFSALSLFKMRMNNVGEENAFKMPFYPILPVIYVIGIVLLIVFRAYFEWQSSMVDLAFVATGLPFAFYWVKKASFIERDS